MPYLAVLLFYVTPAPRINGAMGANMTPKVPHFRIDFAVFPFYNISTISFGKERHYSRYACAYAVT